VFIQSGMSHDQHRKPQQRVRLSDSLTDVPTNLKYVALTVSKIIGGTTQKMSSPWIHPR